MDTNIKEKIELAEKIYLEAKALAENLEDNELRKHYVAGMSYYAGTVAKHISLNKDYEATLSALEHFRELNKKFDDSPEMAEYLSDMSEKMRPYDDVILGSVCSLQVNKGHFEEAIATAQKITSLSDREDILSSIACELSRKGKSEEGLEVLKRFELGAGRNSAMSSILGDMVMAGKTEAAIAAARTLAKKEDQINALCDITGDLLAPKEEPKK